jgi:hypothetical protein
VVGFGWPAELLAEPRFVIGGEEHDHSGCHSERVLKHLSDVRCRLACTGDQSAPLERLQIQRAQVVEHRAAGIFVTSVHHHHGAPIYSST